MSTLERLRAEMCRRSQRRSKLNQELSRLLALLRAMPVEKVILFGSLARGEVGMNSDLDLVVIMPSEKRFLSRAVELAQILEPELGLDLLVYTPEEFRGMQEDGNLFIRQVLKEGKVLYEAESA
ncbi:MAG: nucleotidyltransferase domain-containing protein [Anaerolineae bacterium]